MRFNRGSKVEVLTKKKKVSSGVWRCAELVADNGDGYTVRYYHRPGFASKVVEKVPVEAVRPCSPPAVVSKVWAVGDVVEVLDDGYWRIATIEEVIGECYYYIRLIGSFDEFRVEKSSIRARQEWKENKWVLIEKDYGIYKDLISRVLKKTNVQQQGDFTSVQEIPESAVLTNSLKRSSPGNSSPGEANAENVHKRRAVGKKVELEITPGDMYSFIGKVDTPAYPRNNQVKDEGQTFTKKTIRFNNANKKKRDDAVFHSRTSELDDCVSTISSVASCSSSHDRFLNHSSSGFSGDSDSLCSDAESFECLGDEEGMSVSHSKEEYVLKSHELELDSYRCTLEALYASGPLSWEQELLLTNLRIKLYVSNDEHLMELRRLKSIGNLGFNRH